jgi:cyclohexyl-isocyanide hydratase
MGTSGQSIPDFVIAIPIYDKVDLMDVAAPTEVFSCLVDYWPARNVVIYHVAEKAGVVTTRDGTQLLPHKTFDQLPSADLLWTPGGDPAALAQMMYTNAGANYLAYLRKISASASWTTSVCEGALLLAKAGLLDGYSATTHWAFLNCLREFANINVVDDGHPRFVIDRNRVTGAGISAGIDEALVLIELIAGTAAAIYVQQFIQYFPMPPVNGSIPPSGDCPVKVP